MKQTKLMTRILFVFIYIGLFWLYSCQKEVMENIGTEGGPSLPGTTYDYPESMFDEQTTLGRVLFYDRHLSLNNTISCGSCHKQTFGFADNTPFSRGLFNGMTGRNSSAIHSSRNRAFFWDGRAGTMDTAVFMPVMNNLEMHTFDLNLLPSKLSKLSYYPDLFNAAYGNSEITVAKIRQALTEFCLNLTANNTPFDNWGPFTAMEQAGMDIFLGKGKCYQCHNGNDLGGYFTNFQNIGLNVEYADQGRGYITGQDKDMGTFKVPPLKNIAQSGPYMHDGRFQTLREVIDHYDHGIQNHRNLSWLLRDINIDTISIHPHFPFANYPVARLNLTEFEKQALETFLRMLTDHELLTSPMYADPFRN